MIKKFALYPFGAMTKDFKVGQSVQRVITDHNVSAWVGTVIALHPSIQKIDVQWPTETYRHDPEDLVPVNEALGIRPTIVDILVPSREDRQVIDAVGGVPTAAQAIVVKSHMQKMAKVMKRAYQLKHDGMSELNNFAKVSSELGEYAQDEDIRLIVSSIYNREIAEPNAVYLTVVRDLMDGSN